MTLRRIPAFLSLLALPILLVATASPALANCINGGTIYQGVFANSQFTGCGETAYAFIWQHQRAVQRLVSGSFTNGAAGVDSGPNATVADGVLYLGAGPGEYLCIFDWAFPGTDGCTTLLLEPDISCQTGINSLPVNDVVLSGRTAADPNTALAAVVSVDGNEPMSAWVLDNAGAPSVDGNPCGDDAFSFKSPPEINCGVIPAPVINSSSCTAQGCTVSLTFAPSGAPILDDCNVAMSKALNCTGPAGDRRNLFAGRELFFKKASCSTPPSDTRTFIMSTSPFPGTATPNFLPYSVEDANLNGILDPGEDGSNGGSANGRLDPFILPGNAPETRTVSIPTVTGTGECVYLGVGLALDALPIAPGESVVTPLVSLNPSTVTVPCDNSDRDGDGYTGCQGDCDDNDPSIHPGAAEICNGRDDNCDGHADEGGGALCDDGNACTTDVCGGAAGCSNPPVADYTPCDDGLSCTVNDACHAGACIGAAAPAIAVTLAPSVLMPANHRMVTVTAAVTAQDACGRPLSFVLTSIASSEPDDAPGVGDGSTVNDIQGADYGTPDTTFQLRAERNRYGPGRVYTVVYTATGALGQTASATATVLVPRDPSYGRTPTEPTP